MIRSTGTRIAALLPATLLTLMAFNPSAAQLLQFDRNPEPPELELNSYIDEATARLRAEISSIEGLPRPNADTATILDARSRWRQVALELLLQGRSLPHDSSMAVMMGIRIDDAREIFDDAISPLMEYEPRTGSGNQPMNRSDRARAIANLDRFNTNALSLVRSCRLEDDRRTISTIKEIFIPLQESIELIEHGPMGQAWFRIGDNHAIRKDANTIELDQIRAAIDQTGLDEAATGSLLTTLDGIKQAWEFPEFRTRAGDLLGQIRIVCTIDQTLTSADWLREEIEDSYSNRLRESAIGLAEPGSRSASVNELLQLNAAARVFEAVTRLLKADAGLSAARIRAVRDLVIRIDQPTDDPVRTAEISGRLDGLASAINRITRHREMNQIEGPRELVPTLRKAGITYRKAEDQLWDNLDLVAIDPSSISDPAAASLVQRHQGILRDMERISMADDLVSSLTDGRQELERPAKRRIFQLCRLLLEPNQRPDASRALDALARQVERYRSLPFEEALNQRSPESVELTGGQSRPLARLVESARTSWAVDWANGNGSGEGVQRMHSLYRLLRNMNDIAPWTDQLIKPGERMNKWGGWHASREALAPAQKAMTARIRLATQAALDGQQGQLAEELESLDREAPIVLLAGRISLSLNSSLDGIPDDTRAIIACLVTTPQEQDWLAAHRSALASICRYSVELAHARRTRQVERADRLEEFIAWQARRILESLDDRSKLVPAVRMPVSGDADDGMSMDG